eukprot:2242230-Amphidinium_carterae.1
MVSVSGLSCNARGNTKTCVTFIDSRSLDLHHAICHENATIHFNCLSKWRSMQGGMSLQGKCRLEDGRNTSHVRSKHNAKCSEKETEHQIYKTASILTLVRWQMRHHVLNGERNPSNRKS